VTTGRLRAVLPWLAEAAALLLTLFMVVAGWRRDFHVPLAFSYDALEYLMQVKGTIENGWWWVHPRLSAPGTFAQILYPSNTNVDQAIVWLVHLFTRDPAFVINVSWMIMVVSSGLIASGCLTLLGLSKRIAIPVGMLYALSPYALSRHIDHFSLAIYLVPIPCTVALLVGAGRMRTVGRWPGIALAAGCVFVGLNYTYYAFFACFLILVASLVALVGERSVREFAHGLVFVGVICAATAINLAPSAYAWSRDGKPAIVPEKRAAESEQYGLKIRQLVSPVLDHAFPPFRQWTALEEGAKYPLENENRNARLGLVATVGFLAILVGPLVPRIASAASDGLLFISAARLTLAAVLLATVGGFGSLFNLLVTPEIRAYNRITPFIAFFSLLAVAVFVERFARARANTPARRPLAWTALAAALLLGVYDQAQAANSLNAEHDAIRQEWAALGRFVGALEDRLPAGAMVFELPVVTYQNETGRERMLPNDQLKPYVVSRHLHWSYPALSNPIVRWQLQVSRLPAPVLATALARQGFAAILIDRNGYANGGQSLVSELGVTASPAAVLVESERYIAIDLSHVPKADASVDRLPRLGGTPVAATSGVWPCSGTTASTVEWIGGSSQPFTQQPVNVPSSGEFLVSGWAVDERSHSVAADVDIVVGEAVFPAFYGIERPDVEKYFGIAAYRPSGFVVRVSTPAGGSAPRTLSIRILAGERSCYYQGSTIPVVTR
jgi:phosphoglycerol transferase